MDFLSHSYPKKKYFYLARCSTAIKRATMLQATIAAMAQITTAWQFTCQQKTDVKNALSIQPSHREHNYDPQNFYLLSQLHKTTTVHIVTSRSGLCTSITHTTALAARSFYEYKSLVPSTPCLHPTWPARSPIPYKGHSIHTANLPD